MKKDAAIQLFQQIRELFMKYGIRSLTMDDIARQLRVSKKTIYKHVSDKSDLVQKCVSTHLMEINTELQAVHDNHEHAIQELLGIGKFIATKVGNMHPSVFFDLEKYYPEVLQLIEHNKQAFTLRIIRENVEKGIGQGLYRKELNPEIVARQFLNMMDSLIQGRLVSLIDFSFHETYHQLFEYHIHGIATEKGLKYYKTQSSAP